MRHNRGQTTQKQIRLRLFGIEGTGRNKTEAKQNAGKIIENLAAAHFGPVVIEGRKYIAIVYRELYYYAYALYLKKTGEQVPVAITISLGCCPGFNDENRDDVILSAITSIAQSEWTPEQGEDFSMWILPNGEPLPHQMTDDLITWAKYQLGNHYARSQGLGDNEAHYHADEYYLKWIEAGRPL